MNLSPSTLAGLRHRPDQEELERAPLSATREELRKWAKPHLRYTCPNCNEMHKSEHGAQSCCPVDVESVYVHPTTGEEFDTPADLAAAFCDETRPIECPVCKSTLPDVQLAADCCLWKDIGAADRYRIATAVEGGTAWLDAIAAVTEKAIQ